MSWQMGPWLSAARSMLVAMTASAWEDCVLGRSCDMDDMGAAIRDNFVEIYSQPVLQDWATQLGVDFDESVMLNTLDINDVQESAYFFC